MLASCMLPQGFVTVMEWPSSKLKWLNILTLSCQLSVKFDNDGQPFFETAIYMHDILSYTLFKVCMCKGEKMIGPKPNQPDTLHCHVSVLYTRWGKTTCSNGTQSLYVGMGAGFCLIEKGGAN